MIKNRINCSCFDFKMRCSKTNINCKHIIFIIQYVLKNTEIKNYCDNNIIIQTKKTEELIHNIIIDKQKYVKNETNINNKTNIKNETYIEPREFTQCPICFMDEPMALMTCVCCRNQIHEQCIKSWFKLSKKKTCVLCRSEFT